MLHFKWKFNNSKIEQNYANFDIFSHFFGMFSPEAAFLKGKGKNLLINSMETGYKTIYKKNENSPMDILVENVILYVNLGSFIS